LNNTISFWFLRSYDEEHSGFLLMRDAGGSLIDDDKAVWIQRRATWLYQHYIILLKKTIRIDGAKLGYDFLKNIVLIMTDKCVPMIMITLRSN
jgi:N-acylglucosamine 2-epimerase